MARLEGEGYEMCSPVCVDNFGAAKAKAPPQMADGSLSSRPTVVASATLLEHLCATAAGVSVGRHAGSWVPILPELRSPSAGGLSSPCLPEMCQ